MYRISSPNYGGIIILLSIVSSSAISLSAISMNTTLGLSQYAAAVVIGLIALLCLREVLSASKYWSKSLSSSFNMAIMPLLVCFALIVTAEIATVFA
jgi:hypothetical protein